MRKVFLCLIGLISLIGLAACGPTNENTRDYEEPDWVLRGSGASEEDGQKVFYGVGMVSGIWNRALAKSTAENRSRADLQKIFRSYSAALMRDYMAATTGGDMDASAEEQHVEQTIKTFSSGTLSEVMIIDHWVDEDGTNFALARLALAEFLGALDKMSQLDAKTRDFIRENAARAFDQSSDEEMARIH
jgi:hypothetical protein